LALRRNVEVVVAERRVEIRLRQLDDLRPQRLLQLSRLHLLDVAFGDRPEFERPEGDADEPAHLQPERLHHPPHFSVLAFADADAEPAIGFELALEGRLDRAVVHPFDGDALLEAVQGFLRHAAERAHAVAAQPAGRRQFERPRQPAVIGEQQQALGVHVQAADADQAGQVLGQRGKDGRPPVRIGVGGHQAARLVAEEQPGAAAPGQRLAVVGDAVAFGGGFVGHACPSSCPGLSRAFTPLYTGLWHYADGRQIKAFTPVCDGLCPTITGHLWHRPPTCKRLSTKPAPLRRAARCRSAASLSVAARWWRAPATALWPTRTRRRMLSCWRSARRRPRSARSGSPTAISM